jgi:hypothetical protein
MPYFCAMFMMSVDCNLPEELLPFELFGLCLQEPMALITNWLIALTSFTLFFRIQRPLSSFSKHWRLFYLYFGISTFFGGLGHVLFNYFGIPGKFPCWIFGGLSAFHAAKAMISVNMLTKNLQLIITLFLWVKLFALTSLALYFGSFLFVMIDAVITYLFFCMGFGFYYWSIGYSNFKYTVYAIIILLPSIFIFTLKLNPHIWFNKDDLSHILMVITIIFFYLGIRGFGMFESRSQHQLSE